MGYVRKNINDITPRSLQNLNDNFRILWLKVFGNIDTADIQDEAITGRKIKAGSITADKIKAGELEVGKNVTMGPDAIISWSQVQNVPDFVTNSNLDTLLASYPTETDLNNAIQDFVTNTALTTILGEDYIVTGKIYANQITAGTLTGFVIRTSTRDVRAEMDNDAFITYNGGFKCIDMSTGSLKFYDYNDYQRCLIGMVSDNLELDADYDINISAGGDINISSDYLNISSYLDLSDSAAISGGLNVDGTTHLNASRVYFGDSGSYIEATSTGIRLKFDSSNYFVIEDGAAGVYVDGDYTPIS